jgi:tRNA1(Val) A37 N6-methylase TrmN6
VAQDVTQRGISERILDIGTGPGHLLLALRRIFPNTALIKVDISPAMVAQAQRNMKAGMRAASN